jgi:hypothetical protein
LIAPSRVALALARRRLESHERDGSLTANRLLPEGSIAVSLDNPKHEHGNDQKAAPTTGEDPWPDSANHRWDRDRGEERADTEGCRDYGNNHKQRRRRSHDRTGHDIFHLRR